MHVCTKSLSYQLSLVIAIHAWRCVVSRKAFIDMARCSVVKLGQLHGRTVQETLDE